MTIGLHELLRKVQNERRSAMLGDPGETHPDRISLHPFTFEDIALEDDQFHFPPRVEIWQAKRIYGIDVEEDYDLPVDVVTIRWVSGRLVVLRKLETTPIRAQVRDGVRRAHPWLRLPEPVWEPPTSTASREVWGASQWVSWVYPSRQVQARRMRRAMMMEERIGLEVLDPRRMVTVIGL